MGVCNCSVFCCALLYVHSSIAIILMGKRELIALLNLSSWCLVMVGGLFLAVPRGSLQFVIVVFPDHTHLFFFMPSQQPSFTQRPNIGCRQRPPGGCATRQLVGPMFSKKRWAAVWPLIQPLSGRCLFYKINSFLILL